MLKRRSPTPGTGSLGGLTDKLRPGPAGHGFSRRDFLRSSGMGGLALAGLGSAGSVQRAAAAEVPGSPDAARKKTICPFCSVGCSIWAEVENGVWTGQEPVFESPINQGTHCCKGASAREVAIGERRTKYPMKKVAGQWQRISWEQAIDEIGAELLRIRETYGPDSAYWLGSAKFSNEMAYLFRKFAAFWGTNNVDHQARICHSTTVAGVANTYGYGAMTNSFNDIRKSKSIIIIGGNPAEAHPVSMLHVLSGRENGAPMIVVDPRFTRTAAHADEYVRIRPGADVAFLFGVARIILANGWEDKEYLQQRVWGFDRVRPEIDHWTPEEVERVSGIPPEQLERVARTLAENRPGTLIWCMGLTQSTIGNNKTRAASILQLVLGNIGKEGGGANIFRGHDNVQGATDLGVTVDSLPAYYGLEEGAWKHWARVWGVDYEYLQGRFASQELMNASGIPVSRWHDGVLEGENVEQPNPLKAMTFWGHASNSQTRGPELKAALESVELLVVIDPYPTQTAVIPERQDGLYLLPAATTAECAGSVTNSNRSVQWREKVVEPVFESKTDYEIAYLLAHALGFGDELFKGIGLDERGVPVAEDLLREINRGTWTIGYTGQSPERIKLHMEHQDKFDGVTLLGMAEPVLGETYCLPWPCWGTPEFGHPGTHVLYDTSKPVAEGGLPFRARWGVEYEGENMLAENSFNPGSEIEDGYPEVTLAMLEALGWARELTAKEMLTIVAIASGMFKLELLDVDEGKAKELVREMEREARKGALEKNAGDDGESASSTGENWQNPWDTGDDGPASAKNVASRFPDYPPEALRAIAVHLSLEVKKDDPASEMSLRDKILRINWKTDISGGIQRVAIEHGLAPYGNGKARTFVWNFPDPAPLHREPLYTPRRDLLPQYATWEDKQFFRLPVLYQTIQQHDFAAEFPLVLTSGRLVEYEGGGDETRSNPWLAEFQQQMFVEVSPVDAAAAGVENGGFVWVHTSEGAIRVAAQVTNRVGPGTVFMPYHFAGVWMGENISHRYPDGMAPYVIGESTNTVQTYGYDSVTQMQETKATLCRIEAA